MTRIHLALAGFALAILVATAEVPAQVPPPSWVVAHVGLQPGPVTFLFEGHNACSGNGAPCFIALAARSSKNRAYYAQDQWNAVTRMDVSVAGHRETLNATPDGPHAFSFSRSMTISAGEFGDEAYVFALASGPGAISNWSASRPEAIMRLMTGDTIQVRTAFDFETLAHAQLHVSGWGGSAGPTYHATVAAREGLFGLFWPAQFPGTTVFSKVEGPETTIRCDQPTLPYTIGRDPVLCGGIFVLAGPAGDWKFSATGIVDAPPPPDRFMLTWVDAPYTRLP